MYDYFKQTARLISCAILILMGASAVLAKPADPMEGPRERQRHRFLQAEQALTKGDRGTFRKLKSSLRDYPLLPYLEYQELSLDLEQQSSNTIRDFLDRHAGTPVEASLRSEWLDHLASKKLWRLYLQFDTPSTVAERRCNRLHALLATGEQDRVLSQVAPLWLTGRSQVKECDAVFDAWRQAGRMTDDMIWRRAELAIDNNELTLARYLRDLLPANDRKWVDTWIQIHQKPEGVMEPANLAGSHPKKTAIVAHGLRQLIWSDLDKALSEWQPMARRYGLPQEDRARISRSVAVAMTSRRHPDTLDYLDRLTLGPKDIALHERRIRAAILEKSWGRVLAWIDALPANEAQALRWRYWRARALEAKGQNAAAKALFQALAKDRGYYGFLAADQLNVAYNFSHIPLQANQQAVNEFAQRSGIVRSRELKLLGRAREARREWEWALDSLTTEDYRLAAKLAHQWGWHSEAIAAAAKASEWDDLKLRFPLAYQAKIRTQAKQNQLDLPWVFALTRQESAFRAEARSSAGALGLMQLMPATAKDVARRTKSAKPGMEDLYEPSTNLKLGTAYLGWLLDKNMDHPILATASYNAGPNRVQRWLQDDAIPADIWIEAIPLMETRGYVQNILAYSVIYQQRLGLPMERISDRMQPIPGKPQMLSRRM